MSRFRWVAVLSVLVLVAAACGRGNEQETGGSSETTTSTSASAKSATFGDLTDVCQSGNPSGSPTQGVSPTEIRVATFADPGFAGRPGLTQELFDTAEVFSRWCNDRGGINGRKIVVDKRDSALTEVKARMTESCQEDFFMVGGGAVFDETGVETRLQCLLPDISGYVVNPKARASDLLVQPVPNGIDTLPVGDMKWLQKKYPDAVDKVGVLTGDLPATKVTADQRAEAAEALGWKIVYEDAYPPAGVADWTPYATGLKDKGVKGLIWVGEPENLAKLMTALANLQYDLDFVTTDANHYDKLLIDTAGEALAGKNVYIRSVFAPFENASGATKQYLDAFEEYLPNGKSNAYLGLQAWSAWLLFAQAARECGNDLTRTCVYNNAKKVTEWTGGGLHARQNLAKGTASECFTLEQATPDGFKTPKINPNEGIYSCDKDNVYELTGDYGKGVTLADVGQRMDNLK